MPKVKTCLRKSKQPREPLRVILLRSQRSMLFKQHSSRPQRWRLSKRVLRRPRRERLNRLLKKLLETPKLA